MSRMGHSRGETIGTRTHITLVFAETALTTVNGIHGTLTAIASFLGFTALTRVVGPTLVNVCREDARKILLEFFRFCKIKLLRLRVDGLPLGRQ
jgi:hypothetical protein